MKRIVESHQDYFFDIENATKYLNDSKNTSKARFSNFLSSLRKLDIKGRYLEIGSGPGILTQVVARQHPDVEIIANDISPEMVKLAQQDLGENLKTRIKYEIGDACDIDSVKGLGEFDLIYSTFTLHHWDNAEIAIKNLYSLLKDNGLLYIHDLKRVIWLYYIKSQSGFFKSIRAAYRPGEIKTMLDETGIKNYKIKIIFPFFMQSIVIKKHQL
jgi:SAM-dependent methyltransferase